MRTHFRFCLKAALLCSLITASHVARADDEPSPYLFGDWSGLRSDLEEHGLALEMIATGDTIANLSGGARRATVFEGNLDLTATLDTSKAGLWDGGTAFVYLLGDVGQPASTNVGDLQGTSNIEAPESAKVYELWYNHDLFDKSVSLLAGLHDYNSEFDSLEYASTLRNSSFGIDPATTQSGPSIFPTSSLAFRIALQPTEQTYVRAAVYDGVPGNPNNSRGTHIILKRHDGVFTAAEAGYVNATDSTDEQYWKAAFGVWHSTTDFEDFQGVDRSDNSGLYVIGETMLWKRDSAPGALGGFIQLAANQQDRSEIARYFGMGLQYSGVCEARPEDTASLGLAYARVSDKLAEALQGDHSETTVELTYRAAVTPYFAIQPDFQYVVNPGAEPTLKDAFVASLRFELSF